MSLVVEVTYLNWTFLDPEVEFQLPQVDELEHTNLFLTDIQCGRCRKRKIRCSGDTGNGDPCTNCKSAGSESCQFLRVSSQETPYRIDTVDFGNLGEPPAEAATRLQCRMAPCGPQGYFPSTGPIPEGYYGRNNYPVPQRYYDITTFGEFQEEKVFDFNHNSAYTMLGTDYSPIQGDHNKLFTPAPLVKNNSIFLEESQGQMVPCTGSYQLRPAVSPVPNLKGSAINGSLNNLPALGPDRLLPYPLNTNSGSRTPLPAAQMTSCLRPQGAFPQSSYHNYDSLPGASTLGSMRNMAPSTVPDPAMNSATYLTYSSSSPESLASSAQTSFGASLPTSQSEVYASSPYASSNEVLPSIFHTSEPQEPSYGPSNGDRHSGSRERNTTDGSVSMLQGELANGHTYTPYNSHSQSNYPQPPMDLSSAPSRRIPALSPGISAS
ncbi:hypothetical protein BJ875DRAFT_488366 [Amylocarpus encephaloides]|uniref:Zn(2)-C6 fungal-type domain-containing protein n=1 Tax=Amylocarpus encephaloides TaxID=45428 RepID=A0A9P7YAA1_9HELO|nr:hypothetical protein BJ875DRAFT_488366 [Amylocarpus encephaloides]